MKILTSTFYLVYQWEYYFIVFYFINSKQFSEGNKQVLKSLVSLLNCVLTCSRANMFCVLPCSRANVRCVRTCLRVNVSYVLTCLCANAPCVPTCSRAITLNNKSKFSMTCFTQIFDTFSLSFSCEIKLYPKNARQVEFSSTFLPVGSP